MPLPTVVQSNKTSATAITQLSTAALTTTPGNTLLIHIGSRSTLDPIVDNYGNEWKRQFVGWCSGGGARADVRIATNIKGGPGHVITAKFTSSGNRSINVVELSNVNTIDETKIGFSQDTLTPFTCTTGTLTSSRAILILCAQNPAVVGVYSPIVGNGYTLLQVETDAGNYDFTMTAYKVVSVNTADTSSFTEALATDVASIIIPLYQVDDILKPARVPLLHQALSDPPLETHAALDPLSWV